jgi:DNA-binding MarR family transcriptional regulator
VEPGARERRRPRRQEGQAAPRHLGGEGLTPTAHLAGVELAAWVGFLRTHAELVDELDAELERTHDLTLGDYDVLVTLAGAPGRRLRMADLAEAVLLTRSGLTRLVDRLEERGLVERVRCPGDGRGLNAALTDVGAERLRDATPAHLAGVRHRFLDRLDPEDLTRLADIWRRLEGD